MTSSRTVLVVAAAAAMVLSACGEEPAATSQTSESAGTDGHDHAAGEDHMEMATPADQVDGDVTASRFVLLDTAPPGSGDVSGRAWLAQNDDGTTVTIRLADLEPGREYTAHLHEQECATDGGGDHFAFDPSGPAEPPNEVHLSFVAGDDGTAEATATNDRRVEDAARSVVVHPVDAMDARMVCADF